MPARSWRRQASLQLSDTPSSSEQTGGQPEQANMTGLKVEVAFGAVAMRSTSVTTITRYAA
jgi:hypothetical protein